MNTYTREDIYDLLSTLNEKAVNYSDGYGLPLHNRSEVEGYVELIISKLSLTVTEGERILRIQKHTGCTRAQAQSLIDSGDI